MAFCRCCCTVFIPVLAFLVGHSLYIWPDLRLKRLGVVGTPPDLQSRCPTRDTAFRPEALQESGIAVFANFLSEAEVEEAMKLYKSKQETDHYVQGKMGGIKNIADHELVSLHPRMTELLHRVQGATDLYLGSSIMPPMQCHPDGVRLNGLFFHTNNINPRTSAKLTWHQDFEQGIQYPDAYNYLSIYIFLEKSHPGEGGLSLVPFDLLQERSPELHDVIKGTAARAFRPHRGNRTWIEGALQDENHVYASTMEEVECAPELRPGDALVFRGDVPHATQRCKTRGALRTSMNLRLSPIQDLSPLHLLRGKLTKAEWMAHVPHLYSESVTCALVAHYPWIIPHWQLIAYKVMPAMLQANLWYKRTVSLVRTIVASIRGEHELTT